MGRRRFAICKAALTKQCYCRLQILFRHRPKLPHHVPSLPILQFHTHNRHSQHRRLLSMRPTNVKRWPQWRREMIWLGWTVNVFSLVAASFAKSVTFLKNSLFYFIAAWVLLQGIRHFYPSLYLSSYANSLSYSSNMDAPLLALFSFIEVPGPSGIGYLSHKQVSVSMLAFLVTPHFLMLWGLACLLAPPTIFRFLWFLCRRISGCVGEDGVRGE